ncbi:MAG: branched-chain amino acid ABC transporter permease [Candidatus Eremiobacteraeota bacterium]|nr:branched-chain amino acid ABC transporter permease [Candidatus Eremiobacteraeota bacterium]
MTRGRIATIAVVVLLAFEPVLSPFIHVDVTIASAALLFAIAAMSANLLLGYTGLPPFGNAAFFGLGAYGAALSLKYWHVEFATAAVLGTALAVLGALVLGPFLLRRRGIYFGLLSIAFGQVFYFIAYRFTDVTGGEDGMNFSRPFLLVPSLRLRETAFYYLALVVFVAAILAFEAIVRSPFGKTLIAIKQNELRVRYLGLDSNRFVFVAIVISAAFAGLSGALTGMLNNSVGPLMLDWHQSGDFVLSTILGGSGTIWGPLVGSIIFVVGRDIISSYTQEGWQIILGALFVACVIFFPRGILGTALQLFAAKRHG